VQVGMIRALFEHDIRPDLVVGTSIGAFNGAVLAADPNTAVPTLERFWRSSKRADAFPLRGIKPFLYWRRTRQSFYPNHGLVRSIHSVLDEFADIEDLQLPYGAVAVDVERGVPVLFRHGPLESALLASAAIPGLFPPVLREGRLYYDGGLGNNTLYFDGADGAALGALEPGKGSAGDIFLQAQFPLHSGRIIGIPGRVIVSISGLLVATLSVTGVVIWMNKRRARVKSELRSAAYLANL